jgi:catechol 2,3-dioxygenase-like lactoylglutathione lyase family enzyme
MIQVDHIGIPARDARASAQALAALLGTGEPAIDGADDDMYRIDLDGGAFVLFSTANDVPPAHVAFRVDAARFAAVVERLSAQQIPFGNSPDDPRNGRTDDELGGAGRVYFLDLDGHLFEVTC